jgi:hypothetical protein
LNNRTQTHTNLSFAEHSVWFRPECSGDQSSDGTIGPGPRAFHCAAALDAGLFVFGGRSGRRRLDDFWMLDTISWQVRFGMFSKCLFEELVFKPLLDCLDKTNRKLVASLVVL